MWNNWKPCPENPLWTYVDFQIDRTGLWDNCFHCTHHSRLKSSCTDMDLPQSWVSSSAEMYHFIWMFVLAGKKQITNVIISQIYQSLESYQSQSCLSRQQCKSSDFCYHGATAYIPCVQINCCIAQTVKSLPAMLENQVRSLGLEDPPLAQQPTPVFLPGEFHGQRSPADESPRGRKETQLSDQHIQCFPEISF